MNDSANDNTSAYAHSPLPWRVFDVLTDIEIVTDRRTAHETESVVQFKGQRNAKADAAFIVMACNNHHRLVATLKNMLDYLPLQEYMQVCSIISDAQCE